jgi:hypothetical protein
MSENNEINTEKPGHEQKSKDFDFIQKLILLCLGSLVFSGIIEGYKSDLTSDKSLITEFYRPLRDSVSTCTPMHNQLFLKHGELAGSYQLMFDELQHMLLNPELAKNTNYQVYPMAVFKANSTLKLEVKHLKEQISKCRIKVYQKYEELALATGVYEEFKQLLKNHFQILNKGHKTRKDEIPQGIKDINSNDLVQLMRELTALDLSTPEKKSEFMNRVNKLATPVIENEIVSMNFEEAAFNENQRFHEELTSIFLVEISSRNSPSLLSRYFK